MNSKSYAKDAQHLLVTVAALSDPAGKFWRSRFYGAIYGLLKRNWSVVEIEHGADFLLEKDWTSQQIEDWRAAAHGILSGCADGNIFIEEESLRFAVMPQWDQPLLIVRGPFFQLLNFSLVTVVKAAGIDRVRRCDCGRIWIKVGKLGFCSARCQKRVYMRESRKRARERKIAELAATERRSGGKTTRKK